MKMNTKITALKKKIEIKEQQLKAKEELIVRNKAVVKEIQQEIERLKYEIDKEKMQEMNGLMGEKNLEFDDIIAAITSGVITGSRKTEKAESEAENEISKQIEEINKEESTNV